MFIHITLSHYLIPKHKPLFISLTLSSKSSNESTENTLSGPDAILPSSEVSKSSPIPKEKTGAPLLCKREDATPRSVKTPWSVVCFPVVITSIGCMVRTL